MKIISMATRVVKVLEYRTHTVAEAFGRKVTQALVKPRMKLVKPILDALKKLSDWVVRKTDRQFRPHPVDAVFQGRPIHLPGHIKESLMSDLHNPYQTMTYDDDEVARQYLTDVFRQSMVFTKVDNNFEAQTCFNSQSYYKNNHANQTDFQLKEQAKEIMMDFADHHPPLIRTLSSLANQASMVEPMIALKSLAKEKLGDREDITFGGTTFVDCHLTKQPDGTYKVESHYDLPVAHYHNGDGRTVILNCASTFVKITYTVSAEGKILEVHPTMHVNWPGFYQGIKEGKRG